MDERLPGAPVPHGPQRRRDVRQFCENTRHAACSVGDGPVCTRRVLFGIFALASVACGGADEAQAPETDTASEDAITGGAVDQSHHAAGLLTVEGGELQCTGTLVAPNVVLTAAHCLGGKITDFYLGKGVPITVFDPATKALSKMKRVRVVETLPFPGFEVAKAGDPRYVCTKDVIDVALLKLERPVTDVAPVALGETPAPGTQCEAVGYSTHKYANREYETRYERRVAQRALREASPVRLYSRAIDGPTRSGDSGGGLFCNGKVVGVLSCTTPTEDDHARIDLIRGWLDFQIAKWR